MIMNENEITRNDSCVTRMSEDGEAKKTPRSHKKTKSPQSPNRDLNGKNPCYDVRVKFRKVGKLQFISHLDLLRTMKTALLRAKVPVKYSEGFNPHPKISFALQLSIGTESICEFMELKLSEEPDCNNIKEKLNENLPVELQVEDVYPPINKEKEIAWAEYRIVYQPEAHMDVPDFSAMMTKPLLVTKKTKSGDREVDISDGILRYRQDGNTVDVVLNAGSVGYLNPEYVAKLAGIEDYSIMRIQTYLSDGVTKFE